MKRKRVTIWLYPDQLEFIGKLRLKLGSFTEAEAIRFCINLANVMLNFSPYSEEMGGILAEAVEKTAKEKIVLPKFK